MVIIKSGILENVRRPHIRAIYEAFRSGDFPEAERLAAELRSQDFDNLLALSALHSAVYWKPKMEEWDLIRSPKERADFLFQEYAGFRHRYLPRLGADFEENLYHLRYFIFGKALEDYQEALANESDPKEKFLILMNIGRCQKQMGDYKKALQIFESTTEDSFKEDAEFLSETADCLDMMSQTEPAKLLFREAFFIGAQKIALDFLLSPMISTIRNYLTEKKFKQDQLKEWIPVYGVLLGLFQTRRDLKPLEISRLKQEVTNLKLEWTAYRSVESLVLPRLLNRYFWLLDHYRDTKEDRSKWEEILLNMKMIEPDIYQLYTKN